ncbi:MAG: hypothetical protein AMS25_12700 [Gemmatimonas sp. SM23_52]|nr:MAG: hypothetical protein AMS25_12700 [Gemmatimonas sp. SM23_52]
MITDPIGIFLTLAAVVLISVQLEKRVGLFRSLSAALTGILFGMLLSNVGLLPGTSPTYDFLMGTGVNLGIALILLSVDLRSILQAGPRMLGAFGIGAVGTMVGAITGGLLLSGLVGPETWKLAGQFTGTYTGGGANFAALGRAFDTSASMFSAATAADVILTAVWMAVCLAVPVLLRQPKQSQEPMGGSSSVDKPITLERTLHDSVRPVSLGDTAALVAIAVGAVWGAEQLAKFVPIIHEVLWLTTVVLILAQVPAVKALTGTALFGNYLILLFLASNGARSVVASLVALGPPVFYYATITVALHGVLIFAIGRFAGLDLATLVVASQANVGGPASAIAIAGARGYTDRVLPGVAVGLLGYAIGNYLGFVVAALMRGLLGT